MIKRISKATIKEFVKSIEWSNEKGFTFNKMYAYIYIIIRLNYINTM